MYCCVNIIITFSFPNFPQILFPSYFFLFTKSFPFSLLVVFTLPYFFSLLLFHVCIFPAFLCQTLIPNPNPKFMESSNHLNHFHYFFSNHWIKPIFQITKPFSTETLISYVSLKSTMRSSPYVYLKSVSFIAFVRPVAISSLLPMYA